MNSTLNTVPATTTFDSVLNINPVEPTAPVDVVGNDAELYEVLQEQLKVAHKSGDEVVSVVKETSAQLAEKEGQIAKLKAKINELESNREKIIIGRRAPWGEIVFAEGKTAEEIRDEIKASFRKEIDQVDSRNRQGFEQVEKLHSQVQHLKNNASIAEQIQCDKLNALEASHQSIIEDKDQEMELYKAEIERKSKAKIAEATENMKQEVDRLKRKSRERINENYAVRREMKIELDRVNDDLNLVYSQLKDSFWFKFTGLKNRVKNLINSIDVKRMALPCWE